MNKGLLTAIGCFFLYSCSNSQQDTAKQNTAWKEMNLKGKVKSIRETYYINTTSETPRQKYSTAILLFDRKGRLLERSFALADSVTDPENAGFLNGRSVYSYSDKDSSFSETRYDLRQNLKGRTDFKCTRNWVLIEAKSYDKDGNLFQTSVHHHTAEGKISETSLFSSREGYSGKTTFEYDAAGNLVAQKEYNVEGKIFAVHRHTYDTNANPVSIEVYEIDNKLVAVITYKYTYDNKLNWIKSEQANSGQPAFIIERNIEYY